MPNIGPAVRSPVAEMRATMYRDSTVPYPVPTAGSAAVRPESMATYLRVMSPGQVLLSPGGGVPELQPALLSQVTHRQVMPVDPPAPPPVAPEPVPPAVAAAAPLIAADVNLRAFTTAYYAHLAPGVPADGAACTRAFVAAEPGALRSASPSTATVPVQEPAVVPIPAVDNAAAAAMSAAAAGAAAIRTETLDAARLEEDMVVAARAAASVRAELLGTEAQLQVAHGERDAAQLEADAAAQAVAEAVLRQDRARERLVAAVAECDALAAAAIELREASAAANAAVLGQTQSLALAQHGVGRAVPPPPPAAPKLLLSPP